MSAPAKTKGGMDQKANKPKISKGRISQFLRHTAEKEGFKLTPSGGVRLDAFMKLFSMSFKEVDEYIKKDNKGRFRFLDENDEVIPLETTDYSTMPVYIKACQGHNDEMSVAPPPKIETPYDICAHSTDVEAWESIKKSCGMNRMSRAHIHFAKGDIDDKQVTSGMRKNRPVKIFCDMKKAMDAGIVFYESENGVLLTVGNDKEVLPLDFLKEVYVHDKLVFKDGTAV
jgi:2'-phosphotransferase